MQMGIEPVLFSALVSDYRSLECISLGSESADVQMDPTSLSTQDLITVVTILKAGSSVPPLHNDSSSTSDDCNLLLPLLNQLPVSQG